MAFNRQTPFVQHVKGMNFEGRKAFAWKWRSFEQAGVAF
jgi:hypothetical protein